MKNKLILHILSVCLLFGLTASPLVAQRRAARPQEIVFAVINNGKTIEPIGVIDKGNLEPVVDGADEGNKLLNFTRTYYKPRTVYRLVFGGTDAGSVTVVKNDSNAECAKTMAEVTVASTRARLGGMVMGLATNGSVTKGAGYRRRPTAAERAAIETLVRAELAAQKVAGAATKPLKSQNLTALDVDGDGKAEMVGSYWVETSATARALLFFIAEPGAGGTYAFGYSDFRAINQDAVMSGEIASVDQGVYHEVLLDAMEYDGDTTAEIFTYTPSFEGAGFTVYSKREGQWVKAFENSNYHCGY